MILTTIDTDDEKESNYISIDLSDRKHPNRVLDIYECVNAFTNEYEFTIQIPKRAKKQQEMIITENEFLEFADAVTRIAKKITDRQNAPLA